MLSFKKIAISTVAILAAVFSIHSTAATLTAGTVSVT